HELRCFQVAHAGRICREVTYARDVVAECEAPMPRMMEPGMCLFQMFFADPQITSVAVNEGYAEGPSQDITERDTADAPAEGGEPCQRQFQMPRINQISGERQQGFIRHRQSDDTEHQKREDRQIAILANPLEDLVFHQTTSAATST